ncbi:GlcG/HbpS family heme-binding protein [Bradyrhizobium tropiciagri]|uniref:GlcG/HbpS family heme-binding protein n=1 Tax=Bradyrhizobium tropiciagri TaxID=312253 RepID=UPI000A58983D|nr:heme-binding protein [Bradyrhizobium tropiciagri]
MSMTTKTIPAAFINREAAVALIDAARAAAHRIGFEAAIAVTDATGSLRAFQRTDGASILAAEVAIDKAWTASSSGFATHVWNDCVTSDPKLAPLIPRPRMVAVGGGYPIIENGKLIGGIGISGGNYRQDQEAAVAALQELGFEVASA